MANTRQGQGARPPMHPDALEVVTRAAHIRRTWNGAVPSVRVQKDVTVEEYHEFYEELDYHSRLAGPGPALAVDMKLHAQGAPPAHDLQWVEILEQIGVMLDLWCTTLKHIDIKAAVLDLWPYLVITKPLVIDVASARVSRLIMDGPLAVSINDDGGLECPFPDDGWKELAPDGSR